MCDQMMLHNLIIPVADTVNYIANNIFLTYKRTEVAVYPDKRNSHMQVLLQAGISS